MWRHLFFYKNKLSVYNLTVYDSRSHVGTCHIWHAGVAKRGANEIGSAVLKAITSASKSGIKEIVPFSDSCAGQNKNRFIYAMYLLSSAVFGIKIKHCFLEPGHTYNDSGSVHARMELASKGKDLYDLNEWIDLIKNAKENDPMYEVLCLLRSEIFDFKLLVSKQNWEKDTEGNQITWNKLRILEAGYEKEGILRFQYQFEGKKHYLDTNQRKGHPLNLKTFKLQCAYSSKIPLKKKTIDYLLSLCKSLAMPSKYHGFYNEIINGVEPTEDDDDPDDQLVVGDGVDPDQIMDDAGNMGELDTVEESDDNEDEKDADES